MSSFASSNKNDNNKPSTPRQKKNVFTRLVPQTIRMLEHMPQFSNNSSSQSEEAERKALENKSKLITAYIRDDWIRKQMREKEESFSIYNNSSIFVGTFNVNGKKPTSTGIREWLNMNNKYENNDYNVALPDIYVIGFQEIVDLNAANAISETESEKRTCEWGKMLGLYLNDIGKGKDTSYELIAYKHLVGIAICIYVAGKHRNHIKNIQMVNSATGIFGVVGNKGGSSIRFRFYDSTLCFVCSHLAAHRGNVTGRNHDYASILSKTKFKEDVNNNDSENIMTSYMKDLSNSHHHDIRYRESMDEGDHKSNNSNNNSNSNEANDTFGILDHDIVIWLGDLNYRLVKAVSLEEVYKKLNVGDIQYLLKWDQLNRERREGRCFQDFEEGLISFEPSYKFIPGTSEYDNRKEKKMRVPAWCDRVLWHVRSGNDKMVHNKNGETKKMLELLTYIKNDKVLISDHKPVTAVFSMQAKTIQRDTQVTVYKEIVRTLDKWENDAMPKLEMKNREVEFKDLHYKVQKTETIVLKNIGGVRATYRFVPKLEELEFCKSWISLRPSYGMILPGESVTFEVTACLDGRTMHAFNSGRETLDDILILRFANGPDFFISIRGNMLPTCFGMSMNKLVEDSAAIRMRKTNDNNYTPKPVSVPTELWRLIDALVKVKASDVKNIFLEDGDVLECEAVREALDTGSEFNSRTSAHAFATTLLEFIGNLATPIIPLTNELADIKEDHVTPELCTVIMEKIPPVNHNVFVYIIVYLKEILEKSAINNVTAFALAEVFSRVFTYTNTYEPIEGTGNGTGNGNKKNTFVASSEVQLRPKNQKMMEINGQENMRRVMLIYLSDDYKG